MAARILSVLVKLRHFMITIPMKVHNQLTVRSICLSVLAVAVASCVQSNSTTMQGTKVTPADSRLGAPVVRAKDVPKRSNQKPVLAATHPVDSGSKRTGANTSDGLVSLTMDSDYDGRSDAEESVEGTNPLDPKDFRLVRLSHWRFNGANWGKSEEGYSAISHAGATHPISFDGNGLMIGANGSEARFHVNSVEADGHANFNFRRGSVSFMFKPDWSTSVGGPGHEAVLFQVGRKNSPGYWVWRIKSDGSEIQLKQYRDPQVSGQPAETTSNISGINFQKENWYRVLLDWSDTFSEVRINGAAATNSIHSGVVKVPGKAVRDGGFYIGSDEAGASQIGGTFDEIQTFNEPLFSQLDTYDVDAGVSAGVVPGDAVELHWRNVPGSIHEALDGYRRPLGETNWGRPLFEKNTSWSYLDVSLTPGKYYEYFLDSKQDAHLTARFIATALRGQPIHQRGRVLLLIDETVNTALGPDLTKLETDLVGDGWKVSRMKAPRQSGPSYKEDMRRCVADLKTFAVAHSDLEMIYIIGHVVMPYSGWHNPDGHGPRAFVADGLYGDVLDERVWGDQLNLGGGNPAGDGKFDLNHFPSELKYGVGRVDFAALPAFEKNKVNSPLHEIELLRIYLNRAHAYRHGALRFPDSNSFYTTSGRALERVMAHDATRTTEMLFGDDLSRIRRVNDFVKGESYLWSFHAGTGAHSRAHTGNPADETSTSNLAEHVRFSNSGFYLVDGSYQGEWDHPDSLLRALLATGNGLGSSWGRMARWRLHYLGVGLPIGSAIKHSINIGVTQNISYLKATYLTYLGDPTLRMQILSPPSNIGGSRSGAKVVLNWSPSPEPSARYYVYRSENGMQGDFTLLNADSPLSSNSFTTGSVSPAEVYQVRAAQLFHTGGGSFTNLSQAVFWP